MDNNNNNAQHQVTDVASWIIESSTMSDVDRIVENLSQMKITPTILLNAKNSKDLEMRSRLPHLESWMKAKIASEYNINIGVAFRCVLSN